MHGVASKLCIPYFWGDERQFTAPTTKLFTRGTVGDTSPHLKGGNHWTGMHLVQQLSEIGHHTHLWFSGVSKFQRLHLKIVKLNFGIDDSVWSPYFFNYVIYTEVLCVLRYSHQPPKCFSSEGACWDLDPRHPLPTKHNDSQIEVTPQFIILVAREIPHRQHFSPTVRAYVSWFDLLHELVPPIIYLP